MIYLLTIVLFGMGVGFHVSKTIDKLQKQFPQFGIKEIVYTYLKEEWNVLFRSFLVLCTYEIFIFLTQVKEITMPKWWEQYLAVYGAAFFLGYAGQRLIYKYFATAEKALEDKAEKINESVG